MKTALYCAAIALAAHLSAAHAAEIEGYSRGGGVFRSYAVNGVPLLDSFYFRFTDHERHVQAIQVEPASPVHNPCAECSPVPPGQIFLTFQDEDRDDEYFYKVSHVDLPAGVQRHRTSDYCLETCKQLLDSHERGSVFVITGFAFFFPGADHHLKRVGLWEQNGVLEVHFTDENRDNLFRYELEYVYLPAAMVAAHGNVSGVEARGGASATLNLGPVATGPTVLCGFDLVFRPELDLGLTYDQEIQEIGVRTPGNKVEVYFANDDLDRFDWGVDWAVLARVPVFDPGSPRAP